MRHRDTIYGNTMRRREEQSVVLDRLEPNITGIGDPVLMSIAISLKRIADALANLKN